MYFANFFNKSHNITHTHTLVITKQYLCVCCSLYRRLPYKKMTQQKIIYHHSDNIPTSMEINIIITFNTKIIKQRRELVSNYSGEHINILAVKCQLILIVFAAQRTQAW